MEFTNFNFSEINEGIKIGESYQESLYTFYNTTLALKPEDLYHASFLLFFAEIGLFTLTVKIRNYESKRWEYIKYVVNKYHQELNKITDKTIHQIEKNFILLRKQDYEEQMQELYEVYLKSLKQFEEKAIYQYKPKFEIIDIEFMDLTEIINKIGEEFIDVIKFTDDNVYDVKVGNVNLAKVKVWCQIRDYKKYVIKAFSYLDKNDLLYRLKYDNWMSVKLSVEKKILDEYNLFLEELNKYEAIENLTKLIGKDFNDVIQFIEANMGEVKIGNVSLGTEKCWNLIKDYNEFIKEGSNNLDKCMSKKLIIEKQILDEYNLFLEVMNKY
jgi:hypothetical protein